MLYNKRIFFKELFTLVFIVHVVLVSLLLIFDKGDFEQERFVVNATDNLHTTVVFMPLQKRVVQQKAPVTHDKKEANRALMSYDIYQKKVAQQEKKSVKNLTKIAPKLVEKSKLKVIEKTIDKKSAVKVAEKKSGQAPAVKQATVLDQPKKVAKTVAEKKLEPKSIAQPKIESKPKLEQKLQSEPELTVEHQVTPEQSKIDPDKEISQLVETKIEKEAENDQASLDDIIDLDQVSFIGRQDLDVLQIKELIHTQVTRYYKPPVGISKKAVCELKVLVGQAGKANRVIVAKSSGSMANDMCARAALLQVIFPKEVIGKEIIVELGQ